MVNRSKYEVMSADMPGHTNRPRSDQNNLDAPGCARQMRKSQQSATQNFWDNDLTYFVKPDSLPHPHNQAIPDLEDAVPVPETFVQRIVAESIRGLSVLHFFYRNGD
jgi:hypothetical protein